MPDPLAITPASIAIYDTIGSGYSRMRDPDPRLATVLHDALGTARRVADVGAGTGSYEPADRTVVAIEPSAAMLVQRPPGSAPAVRARAEALPLAGGAVDAVLAVLTLHHWTDWHAGLRECVRVARERVVLLTWDPASDGFWLVRDYLPAFLALDRDQFPSMPAMLAAFGSGVRVDVTPLPIPHDCTDGFLGAYWRRPSSYLDSGVRAGISSFARRGSGDAATTGAALARLAADLASGTWQARYGADLNKREALDVGYRLVVAHLPPRP